MNASTTPKVFNVFSNSTITETDIVDTFPGILLDNTQQCSLMVDNGTCWRIYVVYHCFIPTYNPLWFDMIQAQLIDLASTGLEEHAIQIHVTIATEATDEFDTERAKDVNRCVEMVQSILPKAFISLYLKNMWEYPGIRAVWDLGQQIPSDQANHSAILYFHSKGISHPNPEVRSEHLQDLFNTVISPWRQIIPMFSANPSANKICYWKSSGGWCWWNFWWARASYVEKLVCPMIRGEDPNERYYFESWVSLRNEERRWPKIHKLNIFDMKEHGLISGHQDCLALSPPVELCFNPEIWQHEDCGPNIDTSAVEPTE